MNKTNPFSQEIEETPVIPEATQELEVSEGTIDDNTALEIQKNICQDTPGFVWNSETNTCEKETVEIDLSDLVVEEELDPVSPLDKPSFEEILPELGYGEYTPEEIPKDVFVGNVTPEIKNKYSNIFVGDNYFGEPYIWNITEEGRKNETYVREELNEKLRVLGVEIEEWIPGSDWLILKTGYDSENGEWQYKTKLNLEDGVENLSRVNQINSIIAKALELKIQDDPEFNLDYFNYGLNSVYEKTSLSNQAKQGTLWFQGIDFKGLQQNRDDIIAGTLEDYFKSPEGEQLRLSLLDEQNIALNEEYMDILSRSEDYGNDPALMLQEFMKRMDGVIMDVYNSSDDYSNLLYNISLSATGVFDKRLSDAAAKENITEVMGEFYAQEAWWNKFALGVVKGFKHKLPQEIRLYQFGYKQGQLNDGEKLYGKLTEQSFSKGKNAWLSKKDWNTLFDLLPTFTNTFKWMKKPEDRPVINLKPFGGMFGLLTDARALGDASTIGRYNVSKDHIDWLRKEEFSLMATAKIDESTTLGLFKNDKGEIEVIPINGKNLAEMFDLTGKKPSELTKMAKNIYNPVTGLQVKRDHFLQNGVSEPFLDILVRYQNAQQFDRLAKILEKQGILDSITNDDEQLFKDGDFTITTSNWGQAVGDGLFRAVSSIFTLGFGSYLVEGANAYQQGLFGIAQEKYGQDWESFSDKRKADLLMDILETNQKKLWAQARAVGAVNGVLETFGNFFTFGKIGKGLAGNVDDYLRLWMNLNVKQAIKQTFKAGLSMTAAGVVESLTEVTQELTTNFAMPGGVDSEGNVIGWNSLIIDNWDPYINAMTTAFVASSSLVGGGKSFNQVVGTIKNEISIIKNPEGIIKYVKTRKEQLNKDLKAGFTIDKDGNKVPFTEQMYEQTMELLGHADRIFNKYSQTFRNPEAVKAMFEAEINIQKEIKEKITLEKERDDIIENIKKLNPGLKMDELLEMSDVATTLADLQFINDKIKREEANQLKAAYLDNYEETIRLTAAKINDKYGENWEAMPFANNEDARIFLENELGITENSKGKLGELYRNFLVNKKANAFVLSREEILKFMPNYKGKGIALFSDQNIKDNIKADDLTSTNVVTHEFEHILFTEKFKNTKENPTQGDDRINGFREDLQKSLEESQNPQMKTILRMINSRMKNSYGNLKPGERVYNEEYLIAFGDFCKALEIYGKMQGKKPSNVYNPAFVAEFTKIGNAFWKHLHDSKGENNFNFFNILGFASTLKGVNVEQDDVSVVLDEDGKETLHIRQQLTDDYSLMREASNLTYPDRSTMTKDQKDRDRARVNRELAEKIIEAEDHPNPLVRKGAIKYRQELVLNNWAALEGVIKKHYRFDNPLHSDVNFDQFRGLILEEFIKATNVQYDPKVHDNFFVYFFATIGPNGKTIADSRIPAIWEKLQTELTVPIDPTPDAPGMTSVELQTTQETEINIIQQIEDFNERSALRESLAPIFGFEIDGKNYNSWLESVKGKYAGFDFSMLFDEKGSQELRNLGKDLWKDLRKLGQEGGKFNKKGAPTELYVNFIEGSVETFFNQMPVRDLVKFLGKDKDLFLDLVSERGDVNTVDALKGRDMVKNRYAGNNIRVKKELTPDLRQKLIDIMLNKDGSKRFDMLIESTLKNYASILFNDASMQVVTSDDFKADNGVTNSQVSQMSLLLDKGIDVRFQLAGNESIIRLEELNPKYFDRDGGFNANSYQKDMLKFLGHVENFALTNNLEEDYEAIMGYLTQYGEKQGFDQGSIEFMQSLFDNGFVMDADGSNYQTNIANNPNIPESVKTRREAIRYNTQGKNDMFENAKIMTDIFGKQFMEAVGYEFLGFKNSSRTLQVGKEDGEFTIRFNDLVAGIKETELTPELVRALEDFRAMNLGNGSAQNFTNKTTGKDKNLFGRLKEILENGNLTRKQKLEQINSSGLATEIEAANKANIVIFEHIVTKFMEQAVAGNINEKAMLEMFKMSSGTVFGFRSFSQLIGYQVLNGKQTVNKGEHVASMSDINSKIVDLIYRYKSNKNIDFKGELRGILTEFGQVLGDKKHFDKLDEYKRTNTTNTYRLNILNARGYTNAKGENLKNIQANVLLDQELIQNESKAKIQGQVLEDIRTQIASGDFKSSTVLDFDDTIAYSNNVVYATKGGKKIKLTGDQFQERKDELKADGYNFDFSDYINVPDGKKAPYFNRLKEQVEQHGPDNVFILTARQPEAAVAIQAWLKLNGINLPLENIVGLGEGGVVVTPQMKADWIEQNLIFNGYNDLEFADDLAENVEAVQNLLDDYSDIINRRSKAVVVDPNVKYQVADLGWTIKDVNGEVDLKSTMDVIIEESAGIEAYKTYSEAEGIIRGKGVKSLWDLILPSSTYDLELFTYKMLAKGELGEQQQAFFKEKLEMPFVEANNKITREKQRLTDESNAIIKELGKQKHRNLKKEVEGTNFSYEQAVRVYLWEKNNMEVPGLAAETKKLLLEAVLADKDVKAFADKLGILTRQKDGYVAPTEYWVIEGISNDLESLTAGVKRAEYLQQWKQNVEQIFSPEVKNKLRDAYGNDYVENLENMLYRMEFGKKKHQAGKIETAWANWVNSSVAAVMFLNMRSATLQLVSMFNYVNADNNSVIEAGKRVLDVKQYAKDVAFIMNSPEMKQRRGGEARTVNEAELAEALKGADNKAKAAWAYMVKLGFLPTRTADSAAIGLGGAAYYRNQVIAYEKQGMSTEQAEKQAWLDFLQTTEKNQQSYRPDLISEQQASPLGRLVQAFANTPQQYFRIMNKATQDIAAGRGDAKSKLAQIAYYGAIQSSIFVALQQSLISKFGEDEEEWDEAKKRARDGVIDNFLTGMGFGGQILRTAKNSYLEWKEQKARGYNADHAYTIIQFANLSPTIGSKLRKLYSAIQGQEINEEVIDKMGWNIHNPGFNAMAQLISATTNIPVDRAIQKVQNVLIASKSETEVIDKVQLLLGWNPWDLNLDKVDVVKEAKKEVKIEKEEERKEKAEIKKQEKIKEAEEVVNKEVEKEKKENKDVNTCAGIKSNGERCTIKVDKAGDKCQYHASKKELKDRPKCGYIKKDGKQCGNFAVNDAGRCNVPQHQPGYKK